MQIDFSKELYPDLFLFQKNAAGSNYMYFMKLHFKKLIPSKHQTPYL